MCQPRSKTSRSRSQHYPDSPHPRLPTHTQTHTKQQWPARLNARVVAIKAPPDSTRAAFIEWKQLRLDSRRNKAQRANERASGSSGRASVCWSAAARLRPTPPPRRYSSSCSVDIALNSISRIKNAACKTRTLASTHTHPHACAHPASRIPPRQSHKISVERKNYNEYILSVLRRISVNAKHLERTSC